jgi:hypothetical protein
VGSHAAALLARSGVIAFTLIDFDYVTLSSLNRHAAATRADVGRAKVAAVRAQLLRILGGGDEGGGGGRVKVTAVVDLVGDEAGQVPEEGGGAPKWEGLEGRGFSDGGGEWRAWNGGVKEGGSRDGRVGERC